MTTTEKIFTMCDTILDCHRKYVNKGSSSWYECIFCGGKSTNFSNTSEITHEESCITSIAKELLSELEVVRSPVTFDDLIKTSLRYEVQIVFRVWGDPETHFRYGNAEFYPVCPEDMGNIRRKIVTYSIDDREITFEEDQIEIMYIEKRKQVEIK